MMAGENCFLAGFPNFFNVQDKNQHIGILHFADSEPEMIGWICLSFLWSTQCLE